MQKSGWLSVLHRVGYVTTAVVVAGLLLVIGLAGHDRYRRHVQATAQRTETAYGDGPYRKIDYLLPDLARLPPPAALSPDGLRFVARPELEWRTYAVALRLLPGGKAAYGKLLIHEARPDKPAEWAAYPIHLPAADYRKLVQLIDVRLDGFAGRSDGMGTDGTSIAFERIRGDRITSGGGNFVEPYRTLGEDVLRALRQVRPDLLPPAGNDWYRRETFE